MAKLMRLLILRVLVSLVILLLLLVAYAGYYLLELNYFLFGARDAGAYVETWQDDNADGYRDEDEPPLGGVCVWAGYSLTTSEEYIYHAFSTWDAICDGDGHRTDENGEWGDFFPGGRCSEIRILAMVPEGYRATTATAVRGCEVQYGFVESGGSLNDSQISAEEYLKRQENADRAGRIAVTSIVVVIAFAVSVMIVRPKNSVRQCKQDGEAA
jgi:hypothetical protein